MCFDYDASPPDLPEGARSGGPESGVALNQRLTLTSHDGTQFAAYLARPTVPNGAGIVILPDVRGLFRFYEELAQRFAQAGVEAIAIDYFGRTAGVGESDEKFDYMPHVQQTKAEQIAQDTSAAIAQLRGLAPAPGAIFTVGFCFGGSNSLQQAANHQGLAGVIAFYGHPTAARGGAPAAIDRLGDFSCPVLGLYGGADKGIPVEEVQKFDGALSAAGIEHEIVVYANAPHSFFDRTFDTYQQECADAWMRMLNFIVAHTARR